MGSLSHFAQLRMFFRVGTAGDGGRDIRMFAGKLDRQFGDIGAMLIAEFSGFASSSFDASGSFNHFGRGAFVSSRAENGPAFMMPMPRSFSHGTDSSANRVFWSVYWL